ncbi:MAG: class I SAM-dependent methyltransferase [Pseudomonadota bacterium]
MSNKLGLPIEYKKLPQYFDAHNIGDDTNDKNAVIEKLLKRYKVNTVLDLTCGTGSQVFFLAKRGYKIVGSDFSPALLEIARSKARKEKMKLRFIDGDMRKIKVGSFEAAITMFNAIGHLTKSGFEKALRNIHGNLKDGGIYMFDIINLEAMNDKAVSDLSMHLRRTVGDVQIHNVQCSTIDRKNGLLTSYDNYTIQKNADKPLRINNKFSLQIYSAKELRAMLARNGFKTLDQYGIDGSEFLEKKSTSILTIAQKISG